MKKPSIAVIILLASISAILLVSQFGLGQSDKAKEEGAKPDFSGTWIRDNSKSSAPAPGAM